MKLHMHNFQIHMEFGFLQNIQKLIFFIKNLNKKDFCENINSIWIWKFCISFFNLFLITNNFFIFYSPPHLPLYTPTYLNDDDRLTVVCFSYVNCFSHDWSQYDMTIFFWFLAQTSKERSNNKLTKNVYLRSISLNTNWSIQCSSSSIQFSFFGPESPCNKISSKNILCHLRLLIVTGIIIHPINSLPFPEKFKWPTFKF